MCFFVGRAGEPAAAGAVERVSHAMGCHRVRAGNGESESEHLPGGAFPGSVRMTKQCRGGVVVILAALALMMASSAKAQSPTLADQQFLRQSIETNDAEIAAAHLALRKSNSNDVKAFAERMIRDHTQLNLQMRPMADKLDVEVAKGEVSAHQQQIADQLKELKGDAFDQQYIAAMVKGHQKAVQKTQTEASQSQFPPLKTAAEKAAPIMEAHLQMAQKLMQAHHMQVGMP